MKISFLLLIPLFLPLSTTLAQWAQDPSINTRVTNGGLLPQIISDGAGGAYIVYQDSPALQRQLWVQWLDKYGFVRFPDNGIRVSSPERNQTPYYFLVSDSTGGVIVVFQDFQVIGSETFGAVYAQRIDSTGVKLWGEAGVEVSSLADNKGPVSACSDGSHGVFVFWGEDADSSGVPELWGQRVNSTGELLWPDNGVVITEEFASFNVATPNPAVSDEQGGAVILYSDTIDTKLQRVDPQGLFVWDTPISVLGTSRMLTSYGVNGVLQSGRLFKSGQSYSLQVQLISLEGTKPWSLNGLTLIDSLTEPLQDPRIIVNTSQDIFVAWSDSRTDTLNAYIQKINAEGIKLLNSTGVAISEVSSKKGNVFIFDDLKGGATVVFGDNRDPSGFYGQRFDSFANKLWSPQDVLISERPHSGPTQATSDAAGGAIVCWYEVGTGSGFGIFAQQISRNGKLGEVLVTSVSEPEKNIVPDQFILHQSYPNPFNAEMVIEYELPKSSSVTLTIFDITGKEVIRLINQKQAPGAYQVRWQGHNQKGGEVASGIYFYQLRAGSFVENKKAVLIR